MSGGTGGGNGEGGNGNGLSGSVNGSSGARRGSGGGGSGNLSRAGDRFDQTILNLMEAPFRTWNTIYAMQYRLYDVIARCGDPSQAEMPDVFELLQNFRVVRQRISSLILNAMHNTAYNPRFSGYCLVICVARTFGFLQAEVIFTPTMRRQLDVFAPAADSLDAYVTRMAAAVRRIESEIQTRVPNPLLSMNINSHSESMLQPQVLEHIIQTAYITNPTSGQSPPSSSAIYRSLQEFLTTRAVQLHSSANQNRAVGRDMLSLQQSREVRIERERLEDDIQLVEELQRLLLWMTQDFLPLSANPVTEIEELGLSSAGSAEISWSELLNNVMGLEVLVSSPLRFQLSPPPRPRRLTRSPTLQDLRPLSNSNSNTNLTMQHQHRASVEDLTQQISSSRNRQWAREREGRPTPQPHETNEQRRPTTSASVDDRKTWDDFERSMTADLFRRDQEGAGVNSRVSNAFQPLSPQGARVSSLGSVNGAFANMSVSGSGRNSRDPIPNNLVAQEQRARGNGNVQPYRFGEPAPGQAGDNMGLLIMDEDWETRNLRQRPHNNHSAGIPGSRRPQVIRNYPDRDNLEIRRRAEAERMERAIRRRNSFSNLSTETADNDQYAINWLENINVPRDLLGGGISSNSRMAAANARIQQEESQQSASSTATAVTESVSDLVRICQEMLQVQLRTEDILLRMATSISGTRVDILDIRSELRRLTELNRSTSTGWPLHQTQQGSRNSEESFRNVEVPARMNILVRSSNLHDSSSENNEYLGDRERERDDSGDNRVLNNRIPPGNRANNFYDNFKSYSRQNVLSSSKNVCGSERGCGSRNSLTSPGAGIEPMTATAFPYARVCINQGQGQSGGTRGHQAPDDLNSNLPQPRLRPEQNYSAVSFGVAGGGGSNSNPSSGNNVNMNTNVTSIRAQLSGLFVDNMSSKTRNQDNVNNSSNSSNSATRSPPASVSATSRRNNTFDALLTMTDNEEPSAPVHQSLRGSGSEPVVSASRPIDIISTNNSDLVLTPTVLNNAVAVAVGLSNIDGDTLTQAQASNGVEGSTPSSDREELFQTRSGTSSGPASSSSSKKELEAFMTHRNDPTPPLKDEGKDKLRRNVKEDEAKWSWREPKPEKTQEQGGEEGKAEEKRWPWETPNTFVFTPKKRRPRPDEDEDDKNKNGGEEKK